MKKFFSLFSAGLFIFLFSGIVLAQQQPAQQERLERELEKEKILRERIEKAPEKPEVEEELPSEAVPPVKEEKVLIKKIVVSGVTYFKEEEIRKIVSPYENKELSFREMQEIASLLTELYRTNGYITSRAYIPPQDLAEGTLEIRVLEGKMGDLEIRGNRYFKTRLIEKKITLERGEPFNYNQLRRNLMKLNEHPDRLVRSVLTPGKERGETDVVLEVQDRLPIHYGFEYDNFGSRFVHRDRYALTFDHNNLTGNDDILSLKYQIAEADTYALKTLRYLLPFGEDWELGFFGARSRMKLDEELRDTDSRGDSMLLSLFLNKYLIDEENLDLRLTGGFDYKRVRNYLLGTLNSEDALRVLKLGFDLDHADKNGRTIFTDEFSLGLPSLWGGLSAVDADASRAGAGGKFTKWNIYLLRLQKMPLNSSLLWKNNLQISPYILTATEQFQIGGITNNRGYPPAEKVGDEGFASSLELSSRLGFIPETINVPFTQDKLRDAFTVIAFYDWAHAQLHRPDAGEEKEETLRSAGWGMRLNLPRRNLAIRLEFGWPMDETPSDGHHFRTWLQATKSF
ncbi:MAG: ShlB/FhaC/HecB family hemolysin secretion/activation protein [Candidatus Omnitrophota bacterium]